MRQIFEVTAAERLKLEVIVIDDNSPDGTGELAYYLRKYFPKLRSFHRTRRLGKTSAILEGFKQSKEKIIGVLDADLSHSPLYLPMLLRPLLSGQADLTIASRLLHGSLTPRWPAGHKFLTTFATLLHRPLGPVRDPLSSFFFLQRRILGRAPLRASSPYLLPEILAHAHYQTIQELPFEYHQPEGRESSFSPLPKAVAYLKQLGILYGSKIWRPAANQ